MIILESIAELIKDEMQQDFIFDDEMLLNKAKEKITLYPYSDDYILKSFRDLKNLFYNLKEHLENIEQQKQKAIKTDILKSFLENIYNHANEQKQMLINAYAEIPKFNLVEFPTDEENFIDYFIIFSLVLIKKFERKISLIIVFVLNKNVCKKIIRDFRFYFVGV